MPITVGKYDTEDIAEKENFKKVLKNIQAKTGIVIPSNFEVELHEAQNSKGETPFERAVNYFNMMNARKLLVPDLMGFSGKEISGGSYALGQEHFSIYYKVIELDRKYLANLYTSNIVAPLLLWNYGSRYKGEFKYLAIDEEKKNKYAELWLEAIKTGRIPPTDEQTNHFLKNIEYPEVSEEEFQERKVKEEEDKQREIEQREREKEEREKQVPVQQPQKEQLPEEKKMSKE